MAKNQPEYRDELWRSPHQTAFDTVKTLHNHLHSTWSVHPQALAALQDFNGSSKMQALKKPLRKQVLKVLPMLMSLSKQEIALHERMGEKDFFRDLLGEKNSLGKWDHIVGEYVSIPGAPSGQPDNRQPRDPLLSEYAIARTKVLKELSSLMDELMAFWETYYH